MVNKVGLLCKGNEEMVPFVYKLYQRFLAGEITNYGTEKAERKSALKRKLAAHRNGSSVSNGEEPLTTNGVEHDPEDDDDPAQYANDEIAAFSDTFCRKETVLHHGKPEYRNIKVFFLGMWDCVSSVAVLERKAPKPMPVTGTAQYVRHAVAVDERRVKFKAALLAQDKRTRKDAKAGAGDDDDHVHEDVKEVWFPGCHGDVGGGWPADKKSAFDMGKKMGFWERVKNVFSTRQPEHASKSLDKGPFQMSDIPLAWMIKEIEAVGNEHPDAAVHWRAEKLVKFKERCQKDNKKKWNQALTGVIHDSLRFGYGTSFFKVCFWKFMGMFLSLLPFAPLPYWHRC